jgi:hypothetical protein
LRYSSRRSVPERRPPVYRPSEFHFAAIVEHQLSCAAPKQPSLCLFAEQLDVGQEP